jgi:hypothetical protein
MPFAIAEISLEICEKPKASFGSFSGAVGAACRGAAAGGRAPPNRAQTHTGASKPAGRGPRARGARKTRTRTAAGGATRICARQGTTNAGREGARAIWCV